MDAQPEVELQSDNQALLTKAYAWAIDNEGDPHRWDTRLLETDAHICQYPLWNESLRRPFIKPLYMVCWSEGIEVAYACILTISFLGLKFGLVRGGPVALESTEHFPPAAARSLFAWARRNRFAFLFFSHHDTALLGILSEGQRTGDFPRSMWGHIGNELIVEQADSDDETLARFAQVARRDIRKATAAAYSITSSEAPATFESLWPLVKEMERRKGLRLDRSVESYKQLLAMAKGSKTGRVYKVESAGRAIEMILVVRDRDTAHYVIGALDVPSLGSMPTPSCLVHWVAMRDFHKLGVRRYNLGGTTKKLDIFKQKFHPVVRGFYPLVVILRPHLYRVTHRTYDLSMRLYRFLRSPLQTLRKRPPEAAAVNKTLGASDDDINRAAELTEKPQRNKE